MNIEVYSMLEKMYTRMNKDILNPIEAWDFFIEFLAVDHAAGLLHQITGRLDWLQNNESLEDDVMAIYDPGLLRSDYCDHLGDLYQKHLVSTGIVPSEGRLFRTHEHAQELAAYGVPRTLQGMSILDPHMESGRLLMAIHERAPYAILMGVSNDITMYRMAYTNIAIHGLKGMVLHADKNKHDIFLENENGQHNWQFANQWYSEIDKLLPRTNSPPPNWKGVSKSRLRLGNE